MKCFECGWEFNRDCEECQRTQENDWEAERKRDYYERLDRTAKHPPDEDEWNK